MAIVFGFRHFKIKSFNSMELGLKDPSLTTTRFEAVQKYFHFMYIPLFPVNKIIGTRGMDGKLYNLNPQLAAQLSTRMLKLKTPWYSFLGPVMLAVGFGLFLLYPFIHDQKDLHNDAERFAKHNLEIIKRIEHPTLFDYYNVAIGTTGNNGGAKTHFTSTLFRVMNFNDTAIQFRTPGKDPFGFYSDATIAGWVGFFNDTIAHNPFWIRKDELKKALIIQNGSEDFIACTVVICGKSSYVKVIDVCTIDGPEFEAYYISRSEGQATIQVSNEGDTARNIFFKKITGDGAWIVDADEVIPPGQKFQVSTSSGASEQFSCEISCTGTDGRLHAFLISDNPADQIFLLVNKTK